MLPFNKRTLEGSVDFEEMPGMRTVSFDCVCESTQFSEMPASYIANAYDKGILESGNSTDYIMTMITQDEGGEWYVVLLRRLLNADRQMIGRNRIPAPVPGCDRAHGACYLNLVGRTEDSNHQV